MRNSLGLAFLALAGAAALALAATAPASHRAVTYNPSLKINEDIEANLTDITFSQTAADDATARTIIFFPDLIDSSSTPHLIFITPTLNQAPGIQIGTLDGSVQAGDFGNATVPVTGTITTGNPSQFTAPAKACTGHEDWSAVWLLNVAAGGQSLPQPVPLYVDVGLMELCLPDPAHAPFKIKLLEVTLHLSDVFTLPAEKGNYRWSALNIPYAGTTPNRLGAIETQAIDSLPVNAGLSGKLITKTTGKGKHKHHTYSARLSGHLTVGGNLVEGAAVDIMVGNRKVASGLTGVNGGDFSKTLKLTKTTTYFARYTKVPSGPIADKTCQPPIGFLSPNVFYPCGTITQAGVHKDSKPKRIVKPER